MNSCAYFNDEIYPDAQKINLFLTQSTCLANQSLVII